MVSNDFIDDEAQELLAEHRVKTGIVREGTKPLDLFGLPVWIGRRIADLGLVIPDPLRDLEAFSQHVDESCIDVVDARTTLGEHLIACLGTYGCVGSSPVITRYVHGADVIGTRRIGT